MQRIVDWLAGVHRGVATLAFAAGGALVASPAVPLGLARGEVAALLVVDVLVAGAVVRLIQRRGPERTERLGHDGAIFEERR